MFLSWNKGGTNVRSYWDTEKFPIIALKYCHFGKNRVQTKIIKITLYDDFYGRKSISVFN
jgi:hypothetical protein